MGVGPLSTPKSASAPQIGECRCRCTLPRLHLPLQPLPHQLSHPQRRRTDAEDPALRAISRRVLAADPPNTHTTTTVGPPPPCPVGCRLQGRRPAGALCRGVGAAAAARGAAAHHGVSGAASCAAGGAGLGPAARRRGPPHLGAPLAGEQRAAPGRLPRARARPPAAAAPARAAAGAACCRPFVAARAVAPLPARWRVDACLAHAGGFNAPC